MPVAGAPPGTDGGDVVVQAAVSRGDEVCAEATLIRRCVEGADALALALAATGST